MGTQTIDQLVEGGKATAAPPLGPALGPLGVNSGEVVAEINKATVDFKGMQVPIKLTVDTVTKKLGPTKEDRADKNILRYAKETPRCVIVTVDKPFVHRLRAEGVEVIALDLGDRAKIIKEKLHQKFSK